MTGGYYNMDMPPGTGQAKSRWCHSGALPGPNSAARTPRPARAAVIVAIRTFLRALSGAAGGDAVDAVAIPCPIR